MKDSTARRMAAGNLVIWKGERITEAEYEKLKDAAMLHGKAHLRKRHKQERHARTLARRQSKAWRKRKGQG